MHEPAQDWKTSIIVKITGSASKTYSYANVFILDENKKINEI